MIRKVILLFAILAFYSNGIAQSIDALNEDAEFYVETEDYERAYEAYGKLEKKDPKNAYYKYQKGICSMHLPDKKQEAIYLFEKAYELEPNEPGILLNLGKAYHLNYRFDDAEKYFKQYLATNPEDESHKKDAERLIQNSEAGKRMTQTMLEADIRNIGPPVNTNEQEYSPVLTADESIMLFTYRGKKSTGGLMNGKFKPDPEHGIYYEDIFMATRKPDSSWSEPFGVPELNSKQFDASIAISPDGQTLFIYRSTEQDSGDIYVSQELNGSWSPPERLKGDINTKYYEGGCSITADGKHLYFTSERPGGQGGRDIYLAEKQEDGSWRNVKNLGPTINTPYDEDSPFIHADGITLFFSSKGHNSIGDFDIFYTIKKDNNWIDPINMGYPLNTTDDDRYYVINAKGDRGYFSSNRITHGGNGTQDIFTVTPGILGEKPVLAMVLGYVYGNDKPMAAQIEIKKKSSGETIGPFMSNAKTGKYLVALTPGENYTFHVRAAGYPEITEDLDVAKLNKFVEIRKDFHMTKDGYVDPHLDSTKSLNALLAALDTLTSVPDSLKLRPEPTKTVATTNTVVAETNTVAPTKGNPCDEFKTLDFSALKRKSLNDPKVYAALLAIGEKICAQKMIFKVQIAAYRHPQNYKWGHLAEFGQPEIVDYPDGITRFTQGKFNGIHDAEKQRQKAIRKGQTDAWIVGFIDGKRYTLEELILVDFYNKDIARFNENLQLLKDYITYK